MGSTPRTRLELLTLVAAAAHECWCDRIRRTGTPLERLHEALVPFAELGVEYRERVLAVARDSGVSDRLASIVNYDRGPERCFTSTEMRVGLPVTWAADLATDAQGTEPRMGEVVMWTTDPDLGDVLDITVVWEDGEQSVHVNTARELRRPAPPE